MDRPLCASSPDGIWQLWAVMVWRRGETQKKENPQFFNAGVSHVSTWLCLLLPGKGGEQARAAELWPFRASWSKHLRHKSILPTRHISCSHSDEHVNESDSMFSGRTPHWKRVSVNSKPESEMKRADFKVTAPRWLRVKLPVRSHFPPSGDAVSFCSYATPLLTGCAEPSRAEPPLSIN